MATEYRIDTEQGLVVMTALGVLSAEDVLAARDGLRAHPDFSPQMKQLVDLRQVTELAPSIEVRRLAWSDPFSAGAIRAFLAPTDLAYGVMRMYQGALQTPEVITKAFRELDEACEWLGIARPEWVKPSVVLCAGVS